MPVLVLDADHELLGRSNHLAQIPGKLFSLLFSFLLDFDIVDKCYFLTPSNIKSLYTTTPITRRKVWTMPNCPAAFLVEAAASLNNICLSYEDT